MIATRKSAIDVVQQGDRYFRWRGAEVSRLESLFDAVIALAITLIIVSVEVPDSFDDLLESFRKLPAFAFSFAVMVMCWYYHFLFHRRYGLENFPLVVLNTILMFLVVFYVYPLKFLAAMMFDPAAVKLTKQQMPLLMYMYSGGFMAIFSLMLLMYLYAYRQSDGLTLTPLERAQTRQKLAELTIYILVGLMSLLLVFLGQYAFAGLIYLLIGPIQGINGFLWGRSFDRYMEPLESEPLESEDTPTSAKA